MVNNVECIVVNINKYDPCSIDPHLRDIMFVQDGNGKIFKIDRYNPNIKSHPKDIKNRLKITRYCMIEKYLLKSNKWVSCYISNPANLATGNDKVIRLSTNGRDFDVDGEKRNLWDYNIRCHQSLLKLEKHSLIYIFDYDICQWCYGVIVDIFPQNKLNIFAINYEKYGTVYTKYLHEFSASIALINDTTIDINHDIEGNQPQFDMSQYSWFLQVCFNVFLYEI